MAGGGVGIELTTLDPRSQLGAFFKNDVKKAVA